jgi:hypothetical protein
VKAVKLEIAETAPVRIALAIIVIVSPELDSAS